MDSLMEALRSHPFLMNQTEEQLRHIAGCSSEVSFAAGALVLREGADATTIYLLTSGSVALEVAVPGQGPVRVESLFAGDLLGLSWLFPPYRWQLDARTLEPTEAIAVEARCLLGHLESDPALGYAFLRSLASKLYERLERVRLQRLDVYGGVR